MTRLLDTNVLLALAWPTHQHHAAAHGWFENHARRGWATCALTQLSFIRLSSNPAYSRDAVSPADAAALLQSWTARGDHRFVASPPADKHAIYRAAAGHQQVNDAWLVAVAADHKLCIATFDKRLCAHAALRDAVEVIDA